MKRLLIISICSIFTYHLMSQEGILTDSVRCSNNSEQYYCLYLPKNYSEAKLYPVVFFFEPGARASLPVKKYQSLADQYQFIFACSWNSKNGPTELNSIAADAMITDVYLRYSIDTSFLILSGLSGGSRFSYFYASENRIVKGVIGCGAGLSANNLRFNPTQFVYSPIIGVSDFNFTELIDLQKLYLLYNSPIPLFIFDGKHEWPPVDDFERAVLYQFNTIKPHSEFTTGFIEKEELAVAKTYKKNDLLLRSINFENIIQCGGDSNTIINYTDSLKVLKKSKEYKKQFRHFTASLILEDSLRKEINEASFAIRMTTFNQYETHKSLNWWKQKIKNIRKFEGSSDLAMKRLGHRLLGQIRIQIWGAYQQFMEEGFYDAALECSEILLLIDVEKITYNVFKAKALVALNREEEARRLIEEKNIELDLGEN
jgi:hypothetical protein